MKCCFRVIASWSFVFFVLVAFVLWCAYDEILTATQLIGKHLEVPKDVHKTLKQLTEESKPISAKDYFSFYISYYNNFVLILTAIIGLFGISSFVYFKQKTESDIRDIESKTKDEIKNF